MKKAWLTALAAAAVLLGALAVAAPQASATLVKQPDGHYLSIALPSGVAPASVPGSVAAARHAAGLSTNGNMDYQGGAVMHSSAPYLIFWTPGGETIPTTTESLLERYFTDVATDSGTTNNVYSVLQQYYDAGGYANYAQTFSAGQAIVDTQAYPTTGRCTRTSASHPTCLTDAQLQAEVRRLVAADGLSDDGSSSTQLPDDAPIYFVVLPSDVNECASGTQCADNAFCAYHTSLIDGSNYVLYASIPLLPATGKGCQYDGNTAVQSPNGDSRADIAVKYMSHEDSETITDPVMACTVSGTPDEGCGWWDTATGQEVGDNCNFYGVFDPANGTNPNAFTPTLGGSAAAGNLYNQLINGDPYYIQSEWSNADVNCGMAQPTTPGGGGAGGGGGTPGGGGAGGGTPSPGATTGSTPGSTNNSTTGAPGAAFSSSPSTPGTGQPVSFNGSGSSSGGRSIVAYAWNFGDGTSGSGAKPTHTYRRTGTYTVTLAVGDSAGQMAFVSHKLTVGKAAVTKVAAKNKKAGGAAVLITVNAPGKVQFGGTSVRVKSAGTVKFNLKLSAARQRTLSATHRLALLVTVKFTPALGKRSSTNATIAFRK